MIFKTKLPEIRYTNLLWSNETFYYCQLEKISRMATYGTIHEDIIRAYRQHLYFNHLPHSQYK